MRRTLLILAAVAAVLVPAGSAAAAKKPPPDWFGVSAGFNPSGQDITDMSKAKVGTVRLLVHWEAMQATADGPIFWDGLDRVVGRLAEQGIRLLPFVWGTPQFARDCSGIPHSFCERVTPMRTAVGRQAWSRFLSAIVDRYGRDGSFWTDTSDIYDPPKLPITDYQIWNEANSGTYFRPKPSAKAYWTLLKASERAIHSSDPKARIVLAGLFGTPSSPRSPGVTAWKFLDQLYGFKGAKATFDSVAIHPYSPNLRGIRYQFNKILNVIKKHHDKGARLRVTELGWGSGVRGSAADGNSPLVKGPQGQKNLLTSSFKMLIKNRGRYRLDGVDWFTWRDYVPNPAVSCPLCKFGLVSAGYDKKPALSAFTRFTGGKP